MNHARTNKYINKEEKKIIASKALNIIDSNGIMRTLPLYTSKTDFNRAKAWLTIHAPFTLTDTRIFIQMRTFIDNYTNYTGSTTCSQYYSTTSGTKSGLGIWVEEAGEVLSRKVEVIGYIPEQGKGKDQLKNSTVVLPKGMYAGDERCYLMGTNIGDFTNTANTPTAPGPDFKFYNENEDKYDLLTYRGYYYIYTQSGWIQVYTAGTTNPSGGNTYYYGMSDINRNTVTFNTSSGDTPAQNAPLKNSNGYRNWTASGAYKSVLVGYRHYDDLYLPLVEKPGHVETSIYGDTRVEHWYFNEDFVITSCSGTMDYSGYIDCPGYGQDCKNETTTDDILSQGFYCETGQTRTKTTCNDETCPSVVCQNVTQTTITKCTSSACLTETITDANLVPGCTIQTSNDDGDVSTLPDDIPAIDSWIDPNACRQQTDSLGNYCDVDGAGSLTCFGRTDMDGNRSPDTNVIGDYTIEQSPCTVLICNSQATETITDNSTGKKYGKNQVESLLDPDTGELIGYRVADYAELGEDGLMSGDKPAKGVYIRVDCEYETILIDETECSGGQTRTSYAEWNEGGVTKINTIIDYPDGTAGLSQTYVDDDGTVVGVKYTDRNGNVTYCDGVGCSTDSTYKDLFENPTVTTACTDLQAVSTVTTVQSDTPATGSSEDVKPVGICNGETTTVTIDGQSVDLGWTNGVPVNMGCGQVIESTSTECSNGQTTTTIPTDDGDFTTHSEIDSSGATVMTTTKPVCGQTSTTYVRSDGVNVTIHPDGSTTAEWGDDLGNDYPASCWGSKAEGDICGGVNNPSTGFCEVGSGWQGPGA